MSGVTLDVLIAELERTSGWLSYRQRLMDRRDRQLRTLLKASPDTKLETIHRLLGEIAALDYALGAPDALKAQTAGNKE